MGPSGAVSGCGVAEPRNSNVRNRRMTASASKPAPDPDRPGKPVTATHLGEVVGISDRQVRELGRRGIVPRLPDGKYPIRAAIRAYCAWMREAAAGRGQMGPKSSLTAERLRLVREQADRAALANAQTRGELVPAAAVEAEWAAIATALRARLLALPSRVNQHLPHLTAAEVAMVDREVRDALTELGGTGAADTPNPASERVA